MHPALRAKLIELVGLCCECHLLLDAEVRDCEKGEGTGMTAYEEQCRRLMDKIQVSSAPAMDLLTKDIQHLIREFGW